MTIQGALGLHLRTQTPLVGLVGDRIYPVQAPDNCQVPYAVYSFDRRDENPITSPTPLGQATLTVTAVSRNHDALSGYDESWAVADAFRTALHYFQGDMQGVDVRGLTVEAMRDEQAAEFGIFEVLSEYQIFWAL